MRMRPQSFIFSIHKIIMRLEGLKGFIANILKRKVGCVCVTNIIFLNNKFLLT